MASLTHKLQKLHDRVLAGKRAVIKITGIPYDFLSVRWGGISPYITLRAPDGTVSGATAAAWRKIGAEI
jgi:hypothetical protein